MSDILGAMLGPQTEEEYNVGVARGRESDLASQIAAALSRPTTPAEPRRIHPAQAIMLALSDALSAYGSTLSGTPRPASALQGLRERRQARADRETEAMRDKQRRELAALDIQSRQAGQEAEQAQRRLERTEAQRERVIERQAEADRETARQEFERDLLKQRLDSDEKVAAANDATRRAIADLQASTKEDSRRSVMFEKNSLLMPDLRGVAQDQKALIEGGDKATLGKTRDELKEDYLMTVEGALLGTDEDTDAFLKSAAVWWERTAGAAYDKATAAAQQKAQVRTTPRQYGEQATTGEVLSETVGPGIGQLIDLLGRSYGNVPERAPFIGKQ